MDCPNLSGLDALLSPSSVAVIGASDDPDRIGGRPVSYMREAGFAGDIYPVNPNRASVQGLTAYPSVRDLPKVPDVCLVAVKASLVPDALEDCAERGVKSAVVFSAGFAEMNEGGRAAQSRLTAIARRTGMRIVGPNCLGVFNANARWIGTFASPIRLSLPKPGPLSIASQSGAVGSELFSLLRSRGLDTGTWITTGNEADVDVADAIAYLVGDPDTEIIVAYAEGIRRGRALRTALERAADAGKPVIFMKTGRSEAGAAAVLAHTAAIAGSDRMCRALFRQLGVIRVGTFEELADAAYVATFPLRPAGNRLALMTISGGVGVQMADVAADLGLEVPELSAAAQHELKSLLPFAGTRNPVDVTAQVFNDLRLISRYLRLVLQDGDFDAAVLFLTTVVASEETSRRLIAELDVVRGDFETVALIISLLAPREITQLYEAAGYPVFQDPTRAVEAASVLTRLGGLRGRPAATRPIDMPEGAVRLAELAGGQGHLGKDESMRVLQSWGVPCLRGRPADSELGDGVDMVVEISQDESYGPVVTVRPGGPLAEVLDDVAVRLAPFGVDEARHMIQELGTAGLVAGSRGRTDADVEALASLLAAVSVFAAAEDGAYSSVRLDPVRVLPTGRGAVALEAVIVRDAGDEKPRS